MKTAEEIWRAFSKSCHEIEASDNEHRLKLELLVEIRETTQLATLLNIAGSLEKIASHLDEIRSQGVEI